jgi:hypothetical protein
LSQKVFQNENFLEFFLENCLLFQGALLTLQSQTGKAGFLAQK